MRREYRQMFLDNIKQVQEITANIRNISTNLAKVYASPISGLGVLPGHSHGYKPAHHGDSTYTQQEHFHYYRSKVISDEQEEKYCAHSFDDMESWLLKRESLYPVGRGCCGVRETRPTEYLARAD